MNERMAVNAIEVPVARAQLPGRLERRCARVRLLGVTVSVEGVCAWAVGPSGTLAPRPRYVGLEVCALTALRNVLSDEDEQRCVHKVPRSCRSTTVPLPCWRHDERSQAWSDRSATMPFDRWGGPTRWGPPLSGTNAVAMTTARETATRKHETTPRAMAVRCGRSEDALAARNATYPSVP